MSAFVVYTVQLEPATVHLAAVTFGQVGEMLAGSLAAGWASMSRRANDTCFVSLTVGLEVGAGVCGRQGKVDGFLDGLSTGLSSSRL